jgi:hypothetical protein
VPEETQKPDAGKCAEGDACCCGKKKKSWPKRIMLALALLVVFAIVAISVLLMSIGPMVTSAVNMLGPKMTGVNVQLGAAKVQALRGNVELFALSVGNPDAFSQDHNFFQADRIKLDMNLPAFFQDEIHVQELSIDKPVFIFEHNGDKGWNVNVVMDNLAKHEKAEKQEAVEKKEKGSSKRLKIDIIRLTDVTVRVLKGMEAEIEFDELMIKNIQDSEGNGIPISMVLSELLKGVVGNVPAVGGILDAAGEGVDATTKAGKDAIRNIPNPFKKD